MAKTTASTKAKTDQKQEAASLVGENTTFSVTLPWKEVEVAQKAALERYQQSSKLEGFRRGKAPTKLIAQNLGETGLRDLTLETLLPDAYRKGLTANSYLPLTDPEVRLESIEPNQDWKVTFVIALPPEIKLDNYQKIVADTKAKHDAWKAPKKAKEAEKEESETPADPQEQRNAQINALLEALLGKIQVVIPELLLRSETRRRLEDLGKQLDQMQMTVDDYLARTKRTLEQLQQELAAQALLSLQVELFLAALIKQEKLTVNHDLVHQALPHDREFTQAEHDYVESMLLKQRAVDYLLGL